ATAMADQKDNSKKKSSIKSPKSPAKPLLCPSGCGFFGSSNFNDLCSKCYREREQVKPKTEKSNQILGTPCHRRISTKASDQTSATRRSVTFTGEITQVTPVKTLVR